MNLPDDIQALIITKLNEMLFHEHLSNFSKVLACVKNIGTSDHEDMADLISLDTTIEIDDMAWLCRVAEAKLNHLIFCQLLGKCH